MKFEIKEEVGAMNVADGNLILNEKKKKINVQILIGMEVINLSN